MSKHKILAGNTAPWLRTALTRVEDRIADDVAEQIKNKQFDGPAVVLVPPSVAAELGWLAGERPSYRPTIHGLHAYIVEDVAGVVVVSSRIAQLMNSNPTSPMLR